MTIALVIGCAQGVWEEMAEAERLVTFDTIYCVKMAGINFPRSFQSWVTLHPEFMEKHKEERRQLGLPGGYDVVAPLVKELGDHGKYEVDRRVSHLWPSSNAQIGSGLYGAKVALHDGHDKVILVGCPMLPIPHFRNHPRWNGAPWASQDFEKGLLASAFEFAGRVKSVSGRTRDILGYPTREWLNASRAA